MIHAPVRDLHLVRRKPILPRYFEALELRKTPFDSGETMILPEILKKRLAHRTQFPLLIIGKKYPSPAKGVLDQDSLAAPYHMSRLKTPVCTFRHENAPHIPLNLDNRIIHLHDP